MECKLQILRLLKWVPNQKSICNMQAEIRGSDKFFVTWLHKFEYGNLFFRFQLNVVKINIELTLIDFISMIEKYSSKILIRILIVIEE